MPTPVQSMRLSKAIEDNGYLKEQIEDLEDRERELLSEIASLRNQCSQMSYQLEQIDTSTTPAGQTADDLPQQNADLQAQAATLSYEAGEAAAQANAATIAQAKAEKQVAKLQTTIQELNERLSATAPPTTAHTTISSLQARLNTAHSHAVASTVAEIGLRASIDELQAQVATLQELNNALGAKADALDSTKDDIATLETYASANEALGTQNAALRQRETYLLAHQEELFRRLAAIEEEWAEGFGQVGRTGAVVRDAGIQTVDATATDIKTKTKKGKGAGKGDVLRASRQGKPHVEKAGRGAVEKTAASGRARLIVRQVVRYA